MAVGTALSVPVLLARPAHAQDAEPAVPEIGGDGRAVAPPTGVSRVHDEGRPGSHAPPIDHRSILLDLPRLRLEDRSRRLDRTGLLADLPDEVVPGSTDVTYRGIYGIAVRRMLGYYRQLFTDTMRNRWLGTSDSIFDVERRIRTFHEAQGDLQAGGRWWDRSWRQSLVAERGGAPDAPRLVTFGREIEVIHLGDFALTTEGKLRAGRMSLYLDDDRIYEHLQKTKDALVASTGPRGRSTDPAARVGADKERDREKEKDAKESSAPIPFANEKRIDLTVALVEDDAQVELESVLRGTSRQRLPRQVGRFCTPRGNLLTGEGWNLNCRPNLQLRLPDGGELATALSTASLEFDLNLFPGETRQLWGIVNLQLTARPNNDEYSAVMTFEVVRW